MRQRRKEIFDDQYCLEIFRRAILESKEQAWLTLHQRFGDTIRIWVRRHPSCDLALVSDTEENYVAQTFSRFWFAVHNQQLEFPTLYAALSYLHATLNGVIVDRLRSQRNGSEVPLPEADAPDEPATSAEFGEESTIWATLQTLIQDQREQRLLSLLYYSGLKPRQVVEHCPEEFPDIKEVYRLNHNILERLRRNRDRLRWLMSDEERETL